MNTRYKITALIGWSVLCVTLGFWRGTAIQGPGAAQADCSIHDPSCSSGPPGGFAAGDVVVTEPELSSAGVADASLAVVRFAPTADAVNITRFLEANRASVIEGPKGGGMYTIRLPVSGTAKNDLIRQMQAQSAIVEFIATVQ